MRAIVEFINKNTDWLYVKIFETPIFFIDFWSFVHFWCGGVIITIISIAKLKHKWKLLFVFLLSYEIIEIATIYFALNVFKPETIKDQLNDIVVGLTGGYLFDKWLNFYSSNKKQLSNFLQNHNTHIALFTAFTLTFIWVGFYKYEYNVPVLNSKGVNYTAFSLWFLGIFLIIVIFNRLATGLKKIYSIGLLWIIYFAGLCIFEFTFYHIFGIKESGRHDHNPLIFDIIHGSVALHIFYLFLPFISLIIYSVLNKFFMNSISSRRFNNSLIPTDNINTSVENEIPFKPTMAVRIGNKIKKYFMANVYSND